LLEAGDENNEKPLRTDEHGQSFWRSVPFSHKTRDFPIRITGKSFAGGSLMDGQISCDGEDRSWLRYAEILVETGIIDDWIVYRRDDASKKK